MSSAVCIHCHATAALDAEGFCCVGCRAAFAFISAAGLERYQLLADGPLPPGGTPRDRSWLTAVMTTSTPAGRITVDIQGLTCGACVWVIQKVADRRDVACLVNPGIGRLEIDARDRARLDGFLDDIEILGYRTGPALKQDDAAVDGLVLRAGLSGGLAMAAMSFAFARYFGLGVDGTVDTTLANLFFVGEIVTSSACLVVGGGPFFSSAWRALRLGIVSFDLPVALGLALAFVGSAINVAVGEHNGVFFDSVAMFAALMVIGRLAQRSLLGKSRAQLLDDSGLAGLPVTRLVDGAPQSTTAASVRAGDRLLVRPGDAVVVAATVVVGDAPFSLAWITGEAEARVFGAQAGNNAAVPAGACHVGDRAVVVVADEDGTASRLATLLARHDDDDPAVVEGWQRFAQLSVMLVLALATIAALVWSVLVDVPKGLSIATAVLVVTCPCALGLALPLADELALAALRRRGVFVRRGGFFARLRQITDVVFDKTGTLTVGALVVDDDSAAALAALTTNDRAALLQMVVRSAHPKSRAVFAALSAIAGVVRDVVRDDVVVVEIAGAGLDSRIDGTLWTLRGDGGGGLVVGKDGVTVVTVQIVERLQTDAAVEVAALQARGLHVHLASGDVVARAARIASVLGIKEVHGGLAPEDKAALVKSLGAERVCFVGDGINDAAAFAVAGIAGTPALDRPQLPARADFYTVSAGLGPLDALFTIGARHDRAANAALRFAVAYNIVVVVAALLGVLTPLWCALLMPASSVLVVLLVRFAFTDSKISDSKLTDTTTKERS